MARMCRFLLPLIALAFAAPVRAEESLDLIPRDAEMLVSVRVAKLWKSELFRTYRDMLGANEDSVADLFGYLPSDLDRITAAVMGDDIIGILTTVKATDRKAILKQFAPRFTELKIGGLTCYRNEEKWVTIAFPDAHTTIAGPCNSVELHLRHRQTRAGHAEARKLVEKHDVLFIATDGHSGLPAIAKVLPKEFAALKAVLAAKSGVVTLDYTAGDPQVARVSTIRLRATLRYSDAKSQRDATAGATEGWGLGLKEFKKLKESWEQDGPPFTTELNPAALAAVKALHEMAPFKIDGAIAAKEELVATAELRNPTDIGTLVLCAAFQTMVRSFGSDGSPPKPDPNLATLAKAMRAFEKDNGRLPSAIYSNDGKTPLLSWRVRLLPYLGDEAKKLHAQFKLGEPWDSDHNIRLVMKMPKLFATVADEEFATATTHFQVFTGTDTLFPGTESKAFKDVTDGLANTILIAQAARPVPWTKPQDLEYAANKPVPLLGGNFPYCLSGPTAQVAFADGTIRVLQTPYKAARDPETESEGWADDVNEGLLRGLITPAGGEKVDPDASLRKPLLPVRPLSRGLELLESAQQELTVGDIATLSEGGLSDRDLAAVIRQQGIGFALNNAAVQALQTKGVSETVLAGMRKTVAINEPAKPKPGTSDPAGVVRTFYEQISSAKNPDKVLELFLSADTPATGISGGAGRDRIYTKPAKEFVELTTKQGEALHTVDSLTVTTLGDSLASVAVLFHTPAIKCKGVFTLTHEGGTWRIAGYVWETRLPDEMPLPADMPSLKAPVRESGTVLAPNQSSVVSSVPSPEDKLVPTWQYQSRESRPREYHPGVAVPALPLRSASGPVPSLLMDALPVVPIPAAQDAFPPQATSPNPIPGVNGKLAPSAYHPLPSIPPGIPPVTAAVRWTHGERHAIEGTWRLLKWKDSGAEDYANPPHDQIEQKTFSTDHTVWIVYDAMSREVLRGAGATFLIKGDTFREVPRYVMCPSDPKSLLDKKYESTWEIKDGKLHTWTTVDGVKTERVWERGK